MAHRGAPLQAAALLVAIAALPARGSDVGPGTIYTPETYPTEITLRPLTLPEGMKEIGVEMGVEPSSPGGQVTYLWGNPGFRAGITDDLQLGGSALVAICGDCPPSFAEHGVGVGGGLSVSLLRTNAQQLTASFGASLMAWEISGTKLDYAAALTHDVASFGPFGLITSIASFHGDRPWGLAMSAEVQLQATTRLALLLDSSVMVLDKQGSAVSRNPIPLSFGIVATDQRRTARLPVDLGATFTFTNPFHSGPAVATHAASVWARAAY